jgi:hypothetical protein
MIFVNLRLFAPDTLCARHLPAGKLCFMLNPNWGFSPADSMQRITARFLLLIALVGTMVPVAIEAKATPRHACCVRKGSHHCHESGQEPSEQPVLADVGCCNHNCCRAVTSSQWAHPQPSQSPLSTADSAGCANGAQPDKQVSAGSSLLRSRAPPASLLA